MDHAYIQGIGLIFILMDAFTGWPEAVQVKDHSAEMVMAVLRVIFSCLNVPYTLVSDNASEFCDGELVKWLEKVDCHAMKMLPMRLQSSGLAECMVQTLKRTANV